MDAILQGYIKDFVSEFKITNLKDSEIFEHFCNYCVVKRESSNEFELDQINVGKDGNPGIDGIAILVNGTNITSPEGIHYFLQKKIQLEVDIIFIQSKSSEKFDSGEILKFLSSVKDFIENEEYTFNFNNDVLIKKQILNNIFENAINLRRLPNLSLFYITTGKWDCPSSTTQFINPEINHLNSKKSFEKVDFNAIDAEKIRTYYQEIKNRNEKEITFKDKITLPEITNVSESYLGVIPAPEFIKLIENSDGEISKHIFYDNVRDFQGMNTVNQEISQTISTHELHSQFCIYNNGVTIVAKSLRVISNKFIIQNYQIVNGCQTSHILFQNRKQLTDNLHIPVKIIVTTDYETMNNIIKATNRQTEVKSEAFESLKPFHKGLEEFCSAQNKLVDYEIHYERRSRQFDDLGIQNDKIMTISRLINCYVSAVLLEPHNTHRYYGELLEYYEESLFSEKHQPQMYYLASIILKKFEHYLRSKNLVIFDKRLKNHIITTISLIVHEYKKPKTTISQATFNKMRDTILDNDKFYEICAIAIKKTEDIANKHKNDFRNRHQKKPMTSDLIESIIKMSKGFSQDTKIITKEKSNILYFNEDRGFGFIEKYPDNIFFHITSVPPECVSLIASGVEVFYLPTETRKGLEAKEIELI